MAEPVQAAKRQQIIAAALQVFSEKGYHKAKIEEIAQAAQVGKGTVYEYFRSKEQLFQEMLREGMASFDASLDNALKQEHSVKDKLKVMVRLCIRLGQNYRPLARMALLEGAVIEESLREWMLNLYRSRVSVIERVVREGIDSGEIRPINPKLFAGLFYTALGVLHSPFRADILPGDWVEEEETEELAGMVIDYVFSGIAGYNSIKRG